MHLNIKDKFISPVLAHTGTWEPAETSVFKRYAKPGMTILDIGANIGYYSLLGASLVGDRGKVYAFEPDAVNYSFLYRNIEANDFKNITAERMAVSSKTGDLELYHSDSNPGDHQAYASNGRRSVSVHAVSIDDYFSHTETVDLVKMDIQGFELKALRGMAGTIQRSPRLVLMTEYWPIGIRRAGDDPMDYLNLLLSFGFTISEIDGLGNLVPVNILDLSDKYRGEEFTNLVCVK